MSNSIFFKGVYIVNNRNKFDSNFVKNKKKSILTIFSTVPIVHRVLPIKRNLQILSKPCLLIQNNLRNRFIICIAINKTRRIRETKNKSAENN